MVLLRFISRIPYYIVGALLYLTSLLPLGLLYVLSQLLFMTSYYLLPYRKEVVRSNLENSFPNKTFQEKRHIEKTFYRHLCDLIFESLKGTSISDTDLKKRVQIQNPEYLKEALEDGTGIILVSSHYANFEWMSNRVGLLLKEEYLLKKNMYGLYRPFNNEAVDKMAKKYRGRWGWELIPSTMNVRGLFKLLKQGNILGVFMDQRPPKAKRTFFTPFLNQLTPFFTSVAKLGIATRSKIIYVAAERVSRGYYSLSFIPIEIDTTAKDTEMSAFHLTDRLAGELEKILKKEPAYWLWTHKRWKYKMTEEDILSERAEREFSLHLP